ncbi:ribonuclease HI [Candidatus Parcubacteria bacterium]|nr:ribonuclease HI [Candidatus Parcubacteria bacterium]
MTTIYTDGSSRGNPGPGGWGTIIADDRQVVEIGGREEHTTNNKMELTAAIRALEFINKNQDFKGEPIEMHTDSEYVMKGITIWIKGWQAKGWRTAAKKPVLNQELWQTLLASTETLDIKWKYVAGHAGVSANERADEIATAFADGENPNLYHGPRSSYRFVL